MGLLATTIRGVFLVLWAALRALSLRVLHVLCGSRFFCGSTCATLTSPPPQDDHHKSSTPPSAQPPRRTEVSPPHRPSPPSKSSAGGRDSPREGSAGWGCSLPGVSALSPKHFKDPSRLLGWIAYAHDNRRGLHHPARLAYRRYHSDHELDPPYLDHPGDYLPSWFLERIGLQGEEHPEEDCEDGSDYELFIDLDCEDPPPENPDLSPQAVRWWEACLAQLQSDLPKAVFNSWVKSLSAFSWDEDAALLTLAIPNQYARDWLDSRLKTTIQRCLTGIADRDLTVRILTLPTP